jgi:hypothetical protein
MSNTKYTLGPWMWQLFGDTYSLTAQHGMREIIVGAINHDKMRYPVVAMNKNGILSDIDPDHPNAKLIAAAPEMLEALLIVIEHFEVKEKHRIYGGNENHWTDKILNAVKKATT